MRYRLLFFFCVLPALLFGQQLRFTHFDTRQGLSQNSVHALLEDREGFVWVGTQDGLCRFDGYAFTVFRHIALDTFSLTDNFVTALAEDAAGNIWVGTRSGLCVYQKSKNRFLRYNYASSIPKLHHQALRMSSCEKGITAVIYPIGISYVELVDDRISVKPLAKTIREIWKIKNGFLLRNADTLYTSSSVSGKLKSLCIIPGISNSSPSVFETDEAILFAAGKRVMKLYHDGSVVTLTTLPEEILDICADHTGQVWIVTKTELFVYTAQQKLVTVKAEPGNPFSISSGQALCVMRDRRGLIWIGTSGGGVNICDPGRQLFRVFSKTTVPEFPGGSVWAYIEARSCTLTGTEQGVSILPSAGNKLPVWTNLIPKTIFATQFCFDKRNRLWIGTRNDGIIVIDTLTNKKVNYTTSNSPLAANKIFHLSLVHDSEIVAATFKGCYRISTKSQRWAVYRRDTTGQQLPSDYIISTFTDAADNFWLTHPVGITRINNARYKNYNAVPDDTASLAFDVTSQVIQAQNGMLWISTLGGGVSCLNPQTEKFRTYSAADGLPNDVVYVLLEDAQQRLWMSTNDGLVCLDPKTGFTDVYNVRDGLPANEFVQNAGWKLSNGDFAFGTVDGLIRFNPAALNRIAETTEPVLSTLYINNQPQAAFGIKELLLNHETRNVTFAFTAMNYRVQERIRYSCMLEGFDETWLDQAPGQRMAVYTNLPFGDYVFRVRVRIGNGAWQQTEIRLPVHVVPPFWLRTWFFVLMALLALLLVAGIAVFISRQRFKRQMRVLETERKIHIERERISRDLHDNIGAQITYMVSTLDFLSFRLDKQTTTDNRQLITELGDNARQTMDQLRETIWAMNQPELSVGEFTEKLRSFLRKTGSGTATQLSINDGDADLNVMLAPARVLHLYRIAQEAVNNAVKHAEAKTISVELKTTATAFTISVSDDGKGLPENRSKDGHYGLENMQSRAAEIGAAISIQSQPGKGTCITVVSPNNTVPNYDK